MAFRLGMVFDREFPAAAIAEYARRCETAGLDRLWVIEDCFFTAGVSLSAAALSVTERLEVGVGIFPAVVRNPAMLAMEIATLCGLAPGRFVPGIGHGVPSWMAQIGESTPSPLTMLDETITAVKRLLAGEEVTLDGRFVELDAVQLESPPDPVPRIIAGVQQEKSMALAGRIADGVLLVEGASPTYVGWALDHAGRPADFEVVTYTMLATAPTRREAYGFVAPFVAGLVEERRPAMRVLPFFDEMERRVADGGPEALIEMPAENWTQIGAIGTLDDAAAHVSSLVATGVHNVNVFPGPTLDLAWSQMEVAADLARAVRER